MFVKPAGKLSGLRAGVGGGWGEGTGGGEERGEDGRSGIQIREIWLQALPPCLANNP